RTRPGHADRLHDAELGHQVAFVVAVAVAASRLRPPVAAGREQHAHLLLKRTLDKVLEHLPQVQPAVHPELILGRRHLPPEVRERQLVECLYTSHRAYSFRRSSCREGYAPCFFPTEPYATRDCALLALARAL